MIRVTAVIKMKETYIGKYDDYRLAGNFFLPMPVNPNKAHSKQDMADRYRPSENFYIFLHSPRSTYPYPSIFSGN